MIHGSGVLAAFLVRPARPESTSGAHVAQAGVMTTFSAEFAAAFLKTS